jgi:hypothetical protein
MPTLRLNSFGDDCKGEAKHTNTGNDTFHKDLWLSPCSKPQGGSKAVQEGAWMRTLQIVLDLSMLYVGLLATLGWMQYYLDGGRMTREEWAMRHAIRCGVGLSKCHCGWREELERKKEGVEDGRSSETRYVCREKSGSH